MTSLSSTPPSRRAHAFINHSPETYEARMRPPRFDSKGSDAVEFETTPASRPRSNSRSSESSHTSMLSQSDSDSVFTPPATAQSQSQSQSRGQAHDRSSPNPKRHEADSPDSSQDYSQDSSSLQLNRDKDLPRKRRRTSPDELQILENEFRHNSKPGKEDRERIASLTSMDEKAVQVWFQNKRQSYRRQQSQGTFATPQLVRTQSMPATFQDENTFQVGVQPLNLSQKFPSVNSPTPSGMNNSGALSALPLPAQRLFPVAQPKNSKSLKLSMSADGKAELIERSPLKQIHSNKANSRGNAAQSMSATSALPAMRFATMPAAAAPQLSGVEQECASSLLVLKSGRWR